jgi:predicted dithiol-disulfide oxidoreductase (DUF899 family)
MAKHKIATREEWQAARNELLAQEKELTRRGDQLAAERRNLPWVPIEKEYSFDTDHGPKTLPELFDGARSCSSTTSCSAPPTPRAARSARRQQTPSTVP